MGILENMHSLSKKVLGEPAYSTNIVKEAFSYSKFGFIDLCQRFTMQVGISRKAFFIANSRLL